LLGVHRERAPYTVTKPMTNTPQSSVSPLSGWSGKIAVAVAISLLAVFVASDSGGHGSGRSTSGERLVSFSVEAPCGKTELDGIGAWEAARRGDTAALAGLQDRGHFQVVQEGTLASVLMTSDSMTAVSIGSGYQAGETCWVPTGILTVSSDDLKRTADIIRSSDYPSEEELARQTRRILGVPEHPQK
jgi:hypothetical protein